MGENTELHWRAVSTWDDEPRGESGDRALVVVYDGERNAFPEVIYA